MLLDHGLYRDVLPRVRLAYCRLWQGIVMADVAEIKGASDELVSQGPCL